MLPKIYRKTIKLDDKREVTLETGKLARQADGSILLTQGNTMLLATVVSAHEAKEGADFFPLSVDYQEKFAAAGKIPGGFLKREGKLSDYEVLISRLVDRALRPLFPEDYYCETQINIFLISSDPNVPPDALAALAASAALAVSDIPIEQYISEVRVGRVNGQLLINPTFAELAQSDIDMVIGATYDNVLMVEGELKEISEEEMVEAIRFAHDAIKLQCIAQKEIAEELGIVKREYTREENDEAVYEKVKNALYEGFYKIAATGNDVKKERSKAFDDLKDQFITQLEAEINEENPIDMEMVYRYISKIKKKACRDATLNEQKRLDGRDCDEIRPIWCEVDYLPSAHGSALFTRGETQSLTTATLGTKMDEQMIDGAVNSFFSKFILHYNFPSFSTGEIKPNRAPGRREIGHGNLAFRALKNMIPSHDDNPYTIRLVSDILESNGSSSMATVCAGTLALMDAGIPIKAPVAGIAMGLISDAETGKYAILSDILGDEDHLGDMDFKVTGTREGITACQMDIKIDGLSYEILIKALDQARRGRFHILDKMAEALAEPKPSLKPHAPRFTTLKIPTDMIGAVIGPGGKIVQEIQKESGATISIEEKDNLGYVNIFAAEQSSMDIAVRRVQGIVAMPEVGEVYDGKVKSILPFGAFIEFLPGKEGLLHISEIKWERIEKIDGILEIGEEVKVKLVDVDKKSGKYRLSRKALLPKPSAK
ncbi:MAG: polyribonucleotide nucleotidyltransferase [Microscillaceae bacterium]|nr:polyribonucleotide nucleotidyltransferase [Microscillaceae bacterium]